MSSQKDLIHAASIFIATFAVFRLSPIHMVADSGYEMLFSQQLLWNHSFSLDSRAFPELQSRKPGQICLSPWLERRPDNIEEPEIALPYQLFQVGERFYYVFPPGSALLSMPYVALANTMGISASDQNGVYDNSGETRIQADLAALLMAGLAVIIFFTSRLLLSFSWSLLITVGTSFGTQVWSTASRAMWSQTWGIFILAFVIWLIVRTETKGGALPPVLLGTSLSWLYFVRPAFVTSIVAIGLYVLFYYRKILVPFVLSGCVWLAGLIVYSEYHFGRLLPVYYSRGAPIRPPSSLVWKAFAIHLISPARGLFIYVPVLVFVIYLWVRYGSRSKSRLSQLGRMAGMVAFVHLVFISFFVTYGGHCYGPRLSADLVPWFALLAILGMEGRLQWHEQNWAQDSRARLRSESILAALLLVSSIVLNGVAGVWLNAWAWNTRPTNIDRDPKRLWDWRHPQFLSAFRASEPPAPPRSD